MPTLSFDPKSPWASKTLWINGLTVLVACLTAVSGLTDNIPAEWMPYIVGALAIANFALRFITVGPLALKLLLFAVLLFGASGAASGADVLLNTTGAKPGRYVLTIAADGTVSVGPFSQVIDLSVTPTPTPTPPPSPLTERAKAIQAVAMKATADPDRAATAKGLAELYRQIAVLVATPGQVQDVNSLVQAVSTATNTFLVTRGPAAITAWQPTRDLFGTQWTQLTAKQAPLSDYGILLGEVAAGLDASAPSLRGISPEMMKFIMEILLPLILQLLKH